MSPLADFCADADADWLLSRPYAGSLPGWRFFHQYHHTIDAVFPARGGLLPALRKKHGYRHTCLADAALFTDIPDRVDPVPDPVLDLRLTAWTAGQLRLPLMKKSHGIPMAFVANNDFLLSRLS